MMVTGSGSVDVVFNLLHFLEAPVPVGGFLGNIQRTTHCCQFGKSELLVLLNLT